MEFSREMFDNIINTSQDCVFWKDSDRRFAGANQAFLDFYGFASVDELIGKNDEDMGWHSDPEPYRQDELRVLAGASTYKVPGKCLVHGEERDIIASKRPLYDGGRIVGLVGSFVDVTELHRQNRPDTQQSVYTVEQLRRNVFFDRLLDELPLEELLDPLTGILSRPYAMEYVRSLIAAGTPFSFMILDLDNFKLINDSFGHNAGDIVLKTVTRALAEFLGADGVVGRFGGDELLIVHRKAISYEDKKDFFLRLYDSHDVIRRSITFDEGKAYVTCTSGCASYPADAQSFDALFELIDKALYIGKNKGRNCYIIYVKEKHQSIEMKKITKGDIYNDMYHLQQAFQRGSNISEKLLAVAPLLSELLQVPDLYFVDQNLRLRAACNEKLDENADDIEALMSDDRYTCNNLLEIRQLSPHFYEALRSQEIESLMIVRVNDRTETYGYLICAVQRSLRIWQSHECAVLFFLANLIASYLRTEAELADL